MDPTGSEDEKRRVPPALKKILQQDIKWTKIFVSNALNTTALRSLRNQSQLLEWSCHGIVFLAGWLAFIWVFNRPEFYQIQVNLLIGLLLDIVAVAVVKALVRRRRPLPSKGMSAMGPDKYSFPSGHASRAFLVAFIFMYLYPIHFIFYPPLCAWVGAVCLSRILLERHYFLDVLGGMGLGLIEGLFMAVLWLSQSSSMTILQFLSDEKLDGGEYHV